MLTSEEKKIHVDSIPNFATVYGHFEQKFPEESRPGYDVLRSKDCLSLFQVGFVGKSVEVEKQLRISSDLRVTSSVTITQNGRYVSSWSELDEIVKEFIKTPKEQVNDTEIVENAISSLKMVNPQKVFPEKAVAFAVLIDLLSALTTSANGLRYALPTMMVMLFLKKLSTAAYSFLQDVFKLPSQRHLRRMTGQSS